MLKLLLICLLINLSKCETDSQKSEVLRDALERTAAFFEKLKLDYAPSYEASSEIDKAISEYAKNATGLLRGREKREAIVDADKGIDVLDGFQGFLRFNSSDIRDINFFSVQRQGEWVWFAVVLDASQVSLHEWSNNTFRQIIAHPQTEGTRIVVDSCAFGALLIIQKQDSAIVVLRFIQGEANYLLHAIQDLESPNLTHTTTWHGMNQLYLGVASSSSISIYTWLGEHFDLVQIIPFASKKLVPFYSKGFMHLAAVGSSTTVFRYSLRSNEFIVTQKLPRSQDVSTFQLKEGHLAERFLALSSGSIVLYKEIHDRFVPFQEVGPGTAASTLLSGRTILLFALHDSTVTTFQYDGWRFVELNAKLFRVRRVDDVTVAGEELLLVEYDDRWTLERPTSTRKKSWEELRREIDRWCVAAKQRALRMPREVPELKGPVRILRGEIGQLSLLKINGRDARELGDLSKKHENVVAKLEEAKDLLKSKKVNSNFTSLSAKRVKVKCESKCRVHRLIRKGESNFGGREAESSRVLHFENLNVKEANLPCPRIGLNIDKINVNKLINGISFNELPEKLLKVRGDQEVTGEHIFAKLNVTNATMPVDIATRLTKQEIVFKELRVKQLNLTEGGILLPLNGSSTTISGSIKAPKVKVQGTVSMKGALKGAGLRHLLPVVLITEPLTVSGNYTLRDITIEDLFRMDDLIMGEGRSIKEILANAIPLKGNVSVPLRLSSKNMKWKNVTLRACQNWITANSKEPIVITGTKHFPRDVAVTKYTYDNLQYPKINTRICGAAIVVPEIISSVVPIDNVIVKNLNATNVFGNFREKNLTFDSFKSLASSKRLYQKFAVENITVNHIDGVDIQALEKLVKRWAEPNVLKGPIEASDLAVKNLETPVRFPPMRLPREIRNMTCKGNLYVGSINNVNIVEFLANTVKLEDVISLRNVTFVQNFTANYTHASVLPMNLTRLGPNVDLGSKTIESLEANAINLPYTFAFDENTIEFSNIVIRGSARFSTEPRVENVNNVNLDKVAKEIWMRNDSTLFSGKNLCIENATMRGNVTLNGFLNTLNSGPWKDLFSRVLSKTKSQEIPVTASFNDVKAPGIVGSNTTVLKSFVPSLNDMLTNALLSGRHQEVRAKWQFNQLNVSGNFQTRGKINKMNISTDVVRHDRKVNIVTGKKTITDLGTGNLYGLNFNEWASKALKPRKRKQIVIKGRKTFTDVTFNNLSVFGTTMGRRLEEALLKSTDQKLSIKTIQGTVNAPALLVDGLINDVNLTELINHQLKKDKPVQRISTKINLQNQLNILGNLTIDGLYGGVELKNFDNAYTKAEPVIQKELEYSKIADKINTALQNRAIYINKLEDVNADTVSFAETENQNDAPIPATKMQCEIENVSLLCNGELLMDLAASNSTDVIMTKFIVLNDIPLIVFVNSNAVSVYLFNKGRTNLTKLTELHVAEITQAFVETTLHSLWIVLQLPSQTLALHYEPWNEFQEYVLPASDVFALSRAPTGQNLLFLSNGVWAVEGLARPRNIIEIPLKGQVETFVQGADYYVRTTWKDESKLMRARYVGG